MEQYHFGGDEKGVAQYKSFCKIHDPSLAGFSPVNTTSSFVGIPAGSYRGDPLSHSCTPVTVCACACVALNSQLKHNETLSMQTVLT